jgi:4-hydroxymandelate synthase
MDVQRIDHLEFYVDDAAQAAGHLCSSFGFRIHGRGGPETGMRDCQTILLSQREIRILITSALNERHPAAEYVRRHGDGVAVIGLAVENAAEAFAEAVARGAAPIAPPATTERDGARATFASVSGFGDVAHKFVDRQYAHGLFAPGMISEAVPPDRGGLLMEVDHLAVCLPAGHLADTVRRYEEIFGFAETFTERIIVGSQAMDSKVVQSPSQQVTLTLIEPDITRSPGQIDQFLAAHDGAGVQHIAFLTEDIATAVRTISDSGIRFLSTPPTYYDALTARLGPVGIPVETLRDLNVLADRDNWGVLLQIFTESRHPRSTFFYELIDRHGARTFGSRNIHALYEAVERQQRGAGMQQELRS